MLREEREEDELELSDDEPVVPSRRASGASGRRTPATPQKTDGAEDGGEEEDDAGFIFIQTVRRRSKGTRADAAGTDAPEGLQQVRRGEDAAEQGQRR